MMHFQNGKLAKEEETKKPWLSNFDIEKIIPIFLVHIFFTAFQRSAHFFAVNRILALVWEIVAGYGFFVDAIIQSGWLVDGHFHMRCIMNSNREN